jgi:hypothetical protein
LAARRRWGRFVEVWPRIALTAFADAITVSKPETRRISAEVLDRIDAMEAVASAP